MLTWSDPYNPPNLRYQVRFRSGDSPRFNAWADVPNSGVRTVTHTVSGLANGTRYTFELRAADDNSVGPAVSTSTALAASPSSVVAVPDKNLRKEILTNLRRFDDDAVVTQGDLATLREVWAYDVTNLAGLEFALNLERLFLRAVGIADISTLSGFVLLKSLTLSGAVVTDVSALSGLTSLETLKLNDNGIVDITALSGMTFLEWLDLGRNAVADVSALSGLTSLVRLGLGDNEIVDVAPLAGLTSLVRLELDANEVADASPLANLTSLEHLSLGGNALKDIMLSDLASLRELGLSYNPLVEVSLYDLTSLARLHLRGNNELSSVTLSGLTSLESLQIVGGAITDISVSNLTSLSYLNLSDNAITDLATFSGLSSLKTLILSHNMLTDVLPLTRIPSLELLFLEANAISDIWPLRLLTSLKELHLQGNRISDVSALSTLASLERLDLSDNEIFDASSLFDLPALGWLYLSNNKLDNLSTISNISALLLLDLSDNEIADVSPLSSLTSLQHLDLSNNQVADTSALSGLTSLVELFLQGNALRSVSLSGLTSLRRLDLSNNVLVEISLSGLTSLGSLDLTNNAISSVALSDMTSLFDVDLSNNQISDVSMSGLTSLAHLNLSGNSLTDVSALAGITSLEWLSLGGNSIADISPLSGLTSLVWLMLWNNELADVSSLADLTSLGALLLSDNHISDISPLAGLTSLERLYLQNNQIVDISALVGLTSLDELSLRGNEVTNISTLSSLNSLTYLSLSNNRISDVSALGNLTSLKWLYLSSTGIMDIWALTDLTDLRRLHLDGNAVFDIAALGTFKSLDTLFLNGNDVVNIWPLVESGLMGRQHAYVDLRGQRLSVVHSEPLGMLRAGGAAVLFDDGGHRVPLFPSAAGVNTSVDGFIRVINHSNRAGSLTIEAVDDAGRRRGPVSSDIGAGQALHFSAKDLEQGNGTKRVPGFGEPKGDWRLVVRSKLDIEVLGYARTPDGFVTSLHDTATEAYGVSRVPTFSPDGNGRQVSRLRLINPSAWERDVGGSAEDDNGNLVTWPIRRSYNFRDTQPIPVPAHGTLDVTAAQLESGAGVRRFRGIGSGVGKRRIAVVSYGVRVMSLLQSEAGHLTNISTGAAIPPWNWQRYHAWAHGGRYRVPLLPTASGDIPGFLRIVNLSAAPTTITLRAFDGAGMAREHVPLTLRGYDALHLTAADLEQGNAGKGVGAIGAGSGDWHLEVSADRRFEVLTYAGAPDGFFTSLHDVAPSADDGSLWIPFFNPGSNRRQASRLRLVNWGETAAEVTITAVDDAGVSSDEAVRVTVPARSARDYMSWELESGSGDGMSGALGDGAGKWRLRVSTTGDIEALSLLHLPTGHIANVSTTPRYPPDPW